MSVQHVMPPVELHLFSPREYDGHIELLTVVAHYHVTGHPLDRGCSVNFGRGWFPESHLTYGLITRPYPDGPALEHFSEKGNHSRSVNCYWLLPITKSERDHKKHSGTEALETLFQEHRIEYWNPQRLAVV
jgi:hypothetical protein